MFYFTHCDRRSLQRLRTSVNTLLVQSSSSIEDKIKFVPARHDDLVNLTQKVKTEEDFEVEDEMRFMNGDNPAVNFECGNQHGGHYACSGCDERSSIGDSNNTRPELAKILNEELGGAKRIPALLFGDESVTVESLNLHCYEVVCFEALHCSMNHIKNFLEEIPQHISDLDTLIKLKEILAVQLNKEKKQVGSTGTIIMKMHYKDYYYKYIPFRNFTITVQLINNCKSILHLCRSGT